MNNARNTPTRRLKLLPSDRTFHWLKAYPTRMKAISGMSAVACDANKATKMALATSSMLRFQAGRPLRLKSTTTAMANRRKRGEVPVILRSWLRGRDLPGLEVRGDARGEGVTHQNMAVRAE